MSVWYQIKKNDESTLKAEIESSSIQYTEYRWHITCLRFIKCINFKCQFGIMWHCTLPKTKQKWRFTIRECVFLIHDPNIESLSHYLHVYVNSCIKIKQQWKFIGNICFLLKKYLYESVGEHELQAEIIRFLGDKRW